MYERCTLVFGGGVYGRCPLIGATGHLSEVLTCESCSLLGGALYGSCKRLGGTYLLWGGGHKTLRRSLLVELATPLGGACL